MAKGKGQKDKQRSTIGSSYKKRIIDIKQLLVMK
jgi:hypothetical protein